MLEVNEHSSAEYSAYLSDQSGAAVGAANLALARLTLYDRDTDTILNGRDDQNVLNMNDVLIADVIESGVTKTKVTWAMQPADNAVINQARKGGEPHTGLFTFEWPGGHHHHEAIIYVRPLAHVPRPAEA
jgi:hypothetical protein